MATTLLNLASVAIVKGKPFMLSEWNEYGEHPFHSTAYVHTVAYACLNDWDGLMGCFRRCCRCREITKDIKSSGFHGA